MDHAVCFGNGKGGVGKTSICANVAGVAAATGWRVLAVDLDHQANLGNDLGYKGGRYDDQGAGLADAVMSGAPLQPIRRVRTGLDVIPGGTHLTRLWRWMGAEPAMRVPRLNTAVEGLANAYDVVMIDSPPAGGVAVDSALASSRWLVIPVKADEASLDGLELMSRQFSSALRTNPALQLAGVAMFDFGMQGTAIRREVRRSLMQDLNGIAPVYRSFIRRSERSAVDMRRSGILAHEYAAEATAQRKAVSVGQRIKASRAGSPVRTYSSAADGLAEDYRKLTGEILLSLGDLHEKVNR